LKFIIEDNDDGSYVVRYQVEEPCEVHISVELKNEKGDDVPIRSSNKVATFSENA
jgi:dynein heavy chain